MLNHDVFEVKMLIFKEDSLERAPAVHCISRRNEMSSYSQSTKAVATIINC